MLKRKNYSMLQKRKDFIIKKNFFGRSNFLSAKFFNIPCFEIDVSPLVSFPSGFFTSHVLSRPFFPFQSVLCDLYNYHFFYLLLFIPNIQKNDSFSIGIDFNRVHIMLKFQQRQWNTDLAITLHNTCITRSISYQIIFHMQKDIPSIFFNCNSGHKQSFLCFDLILQQVC